MSALRLLEREGELAALDAALDDACAGSGRAVAVQGSAGIGKSSLLAATRATAERCGLLVCSARGIDLERDHAFGVARQLLASPVLVGSEAERGMLLAGAAALAAG